MLRIVVKGATLYDYRELAQLLNVRRKLEAIVVDEERVQILHPF